MPTCTFKVSEDHQLIVPVTFGNPDSGQELTVEAEIDTGAETTIIHQHIVETLQLPDVGPQFIHSPNSSVIICKGYYANITLQFKEGIQIELGTQYVHDGITACQCILGRDILSRGLLIYNGINSYFTLSL